MRAIIYVTMFVLFSSHGYAQEAEKSKGFKWGNVKALPRLDLTSTWTNNLWKKRTKEKSTNIFVTAPGLKLQMGTPVMKYILDVGAEYGEYNRSQADNYQDQFLSAQAVYQPNKRFKLDMKGKVDKEHDDRSDGRSVLGVFLPKPDEYSSRSVSATMTYGVADGNGQLMLALDHLDKEYSNNRAQTFNLDHDETGGMLGLKWKVAPKTKAVAELSNRDYDYNTFAATSTTVDSEEDKFLVGAEWEATFQTTGSLKVGRISKDFKSSSRRDISKGIWDASIKWSPVKPTTITFTSNRGMSESYGTGNVSLSKTHGVSWKQVWLERLSSDVGYTYKEEETPGTTPLDKSNTDSLKVSVDYTMRRWLKLSAGYNRSVKDHDNNINSNYSRDDVFLKAAIEL